MWPPAACPGAADGGRAIYDRLRAPETGGPGTAGQRGSGAVGGGALPCGAGRGVPGAPGAAADPGQQLHPGALPGGGVQAGTAGGDAAVPAQGARLCVSRPDAGSGGGGL